MPPSWPAPLRKPWDASGGRRGAYPRHENDDAYGSPHSRVDPFGGRSSFAQADGTHGRQKSPHESERHESERHEGKRHESKRHEGKRHESKRHEGKRHEGEAFEGPSNARQHGEEGTCDAWSSWRDAYQAFSDAGPVELPPGDGDEAELDRAFAAHERWAFDRAYERYSRLLYAAAYGVLRVREEAEDCVHDALARVWKNPAAYSTQRGSVRSFLAVCVRNEAISRTRKAATRSGAERRAARPERSEDPELPDFVQRERLRRAIAQLPDDQRRALYMAYFQEKTHVQIASQLGAPLGTVKGRLALAVRKLGRALQGGAT